METAQCGVGLAHHSSQVERPMSGFKVVTMVRRFAKKKHSAALAQLVSRTSAIMKFGAGAGVDPFMKVKGLITDLINRLQTEASSDASHKSYCDEETSKATEISRPILGSNLPNSKRPWSDPPFWTAFDKAADRAATTLMHVFSGPLANDCEMLMQSLEDPLAQVQARLVGRRVTPISRRRRMFGLFEDVTGRQHE